MNFLVLISLKVPVQPWHTACISRGGTSTHLEKQGLLSGDLDMNLTWKLKDKWGIGRDTEVKRSPQDSSQGSGYRHNSCVALQAPGQESPSGLPRLLRGHQDAHH